MVLLGLLLVVLSGGAVGLLAYYNRSGGPELPVELFGNQIATVNAWETFFAGVAVTLVFCLGLWMMMAGGRRRRRLRAEVAAARHDAQTAQAERDRLAEQLGDQPAPGSAEHIQGDADTHGRRRFFGRTPTSSGAPRGGGR